SPAYDHHDDPRADADGAERHVPPQRSQLAARQAGAAVRSIYVTSPEGGAGKSVIALGLVDLLARRVRRVGVFRPVTHTGAAADGPDDDLLELLVEHDSVQLAPSACIRGGYADVHRAPEAALATIIERYRAIRDDCDVAVIVGSDYTDVPSPAELTFNARVAANLSAPVLLVVSGHGRTPAEVAQVVELAMAELRQEHAGTVGIVANRCDPDELEAVHQQLAGFGLPTWALPEIPVLSAPTVADLVVALDGALLYGDAALLAREAEQMLVCAMNVEHIVERLQDGQLCI